MDDEIPDVDELETPGWISPFRARKERKEREVAERLAEDAARQTRRAKEQQEWAAKSSEEKAHFYLEEMGASKQAFLSWHYRETHATMATIYLLQALNEKIDRLLEVRKD